MREGCQIPWELKGQILAVVATQEGGQRVSGGGAPVFWARDEKEQERLGTILSRALDAVAHDLENGILIIVRH